MSFSKARIQRFNECENDVPPPGSYDPKIDSKVKGFAIEKSERFHDSKSIDSAEGNLSVCTKNTSNVVASFRTPQLPRKHNGDQIHRSNQKVKSRALISANDQKLKYNSEHQLADLQVECTNKDKTIQELERHIEDLKEEVRKLELELNELQKKQTEVEEQHRKDIETMAKLQQNVLHDHDERHQSDVKHLRCQLLEVSEEKEREIAARKVMEGDLRNRIADFSKRIVVLESELVDKKCTNIEKIETLETQIKELTTKLETTTVSQKHEINLLEQENTKLNSYISDLTDENDQLELKLQQRQNVIFELQAQLSTLQCELDELKAEYEKLAENSSQQVDNVKHKYDEEIDKLKINFEQEKVILVNENQSERSRRIEIETKVNDVETQNKFLEEELEEVQELYNDVRNCLRQAQQELEESDKKHYLVLEKHKADLDGITKLHDEEVCKLKQQLENEKLNYVNEIENLMIAKHKEVAEIKEAAIKKIDEETKRIKQHADKIIENAETVTKDAVAACRTECEERIQSAIADNDAKENCKLLEEERNKWKSFGYAIIEKLEGEKFRRETVEGEMKRLFNCNEQLLKDYQEIYEKYAEVVGHQNHRQRIKHVSQLKNKISQLEQDLHAKMRTIEQQQKIIEKLKAEEKCSHSKGKGNMVGIPRSTHTTPVSTPHKLLTPLRNRNE